MERLYCPKCNERITGKSGKSTSGRQRYKCESGHRTTNPIHNQIDSHDLFDKKQIKKYISQIHKNKSLSDIQRYVITSAQSNTPVHKAFFNALLTYCEYNDTKLLVIPVRYKNPTNLKEWAKNDLWWPTEVLPYILNKSVNLNKQICVRGDIKIAATATDPVTGLETISGTKSAIFGHAQVRMKMIATPQDRLPKMLHTTGSVSVKNYSLTKAGAKGKHHHSLAAVFVECQKDSFFVREISAEPSGFFHDLDIRYGPDKIERGHRIEALITGDEHTIHASPEVTSATYTNSNSIVNILKPRVIVRHDVLDFYTQNHHHKGNLFRKYTKYVKKQLNVLDELNGVIDYIDATTPKNTMNYIVASNHNDALTRWLNEFKPFEDLVNLKIYAKLLGMMCDKIHETGEVPDAFEIYSENKFKSNTSFLHRKNSCLIRGIDVSQHGDAGANGARGSIRSFASSEYKSIIGHSHSPGIHFGCYQVGTSSVLDLEYNRGLSSWMNTHAIIYPNGKRSLIHIVKGKWRAE